ncbi:TonB family C-terminal domain-containing protein [Tenacibaculum sediminilitoris]
MVDKCLIEKKENNNYKSPVIVTVVSSRRYLRKRVYFKKAISLTNNLKATALAPLKINNKLLMTSLDNIAPITIESEKGVSFDSVDEIPMFLSCVELSTDKIDCFNYEMQRHIINTLVYPEEALKKELEGEVNVSFVIDETGKVTDVETKGINVHETFKNEARRIVLLLPNFTPGKHKSKNTKVVYSFPMNFSLDTSVD